MALRLKQSFIRHLKPYKYVMQDFVWEQLDCSARAMMRYNQWKEEWILGQIKYYM